MKTALVATGGTIGSRLDASGSIVLSDAATEQISTIVGAVLVTPGSATLAYSAAYLAYSFCSTDIPIVLCAADLPLTDHESNGFAVLNSAKTFVQSRKSGVYAVCKNPGLPPKIHHGARLLPAHFFDSSFGSIAGGAFCDTGLFNGMDFDVSGVKALMINPYVGMDYSGFKLDG